MSPSLLPVVGHGPKHHPTVLLARWRYRLLGLQPGDVVDVLLDNGDIVRTRLRGHRLVEQAGHRQPQPQVWVDGIVGSYSAARIRPADGWWRMRGVERLTVELQDLKDLLFLQTAAHDAAVRERDAARDERDAARDEIDRLLGGIRTTHPRPVNEAEATAFPWWAILEVQRAMRAASVDVDDAALVIAKAIHGPFASREEAEKALARGRYDEDAEVWCLSGASAPWWRSQCVDVDDGGGGPAAEASAEESSP